MTTVSPPFAKNEMRKSTMKSLFVGITFFSTLSFWNAFIPLILQSRGVTLPEVFFARSFYFIAKAILELPTGLLADRLNLENDL